MRRTQRGLTLVELMVTLAVAIILLAVGMPLFNGVVENNRATSHVNALSQALQLARSEAVKTGDSAGVCPKASSDPANLECGDESNWANGWMVYRGTLAGSTVDEDDLLKVWAAPTGIEVITAADALAFNETGVLNGAAAALTVRLTNCPSGAPLQRDLTISAVGQVQTERGECP